MTDKEKIRIKNIYYMLTYAYQILRQWENKEIQTEEFEHIHDLFAAILGRGVAQQLKCGLYREYVEKTENLTVMRGKVNITNTIQNCIQNKLKLFCEYDELSENNCWNQIIKTTMVLLLKQNTVKQKQKALLKKDLIYFTNVDEIKPDCICWEKMERKRNNQTYGMLIDICNLVLEGLLFTTEQGNKKMASFLDEQRMSRLYEKFILGYYQCHHPRLQPNADQIRWNLDNKKGEFLPIMQTDITLRKGEKKLIIDTKYYKDIMQKRFDTKTIRSEHLYQIFTYVKNLDREGTGNVGGLLLYAKTEEVIQQRKECYLIGGNPIGVQTLDLDQPFWQITKQLEEIVKEFFYS